LFFSSNIKDVNKGYQSILETTKILRDEEILFVGVGDLNIKNSKNIKTIQYISDESLMAEVYNLADVFLYTSLVESCPMTIIESMACGVPVVAFEAQGVQELVDKDSGFLSKTGDVLELANDVEFLLDNKELKENMSISGRRKIVESFSLERMLTEYKKLYKNILNI
jgi:glycosyltransferase involved in cell wall biosynthesis